MNPILEPVRFRGYANRDVDDNEIARPRHRSSFDFFSFSEILGLPRLAVNRRRPGQILMLVDLFDPACRCSLIRSDEVRDAAVK